MILGFDLENNRLIVGARAGRGASYVRPALFVITLQAIVVFVSIVIGIVLALALLVPRVAAGQEFDPVRFGEELITMVSVGGPALLLSLPQVLLIIGYTWAWVKLIERRSFKTIGLERAGALFQWGRGMLLGAGIFLLGLAFIAPTGGLRWEGLAPAGIGPALMWTILTLLFFLIQGPAEEIMVRGYLLPTLVARGGLWLGILVSSILFSLMHLLNPNLSLIAILNLILFGILAALYALREGGLWGVFGVHTAWNWLQGNVLGLPVSGMSLGPAPLLDFDTVDPSWWSGGAFGPEGGLAVTLSLLLTIAVLMFWRRLWCKHSLS